MKKVLWFSRHELSPAQVSDLGALFGPIEVTQIDRTIQSVREIEAEVAAADILAIVAPLPLQGEFLRDNLASVANDLCKELVLVIQWPAAKPVAIKADFEQRLSTA